ncbi:serine hydrolase [Nocardia arthritidis]|uniref:Serine hydrolase n=1 Tax=Nocardia arthritidis TaxID=228602 RepID=A0A6G9YIE2_9NOCA|nr:serine hydrolase [Nocardia arthritidis]QIS12954.1 hypothetical protein F5544_25500 [Nocardia arthritidis]
MVVGAIAAGAATAMVIGVPTAMAQGHRPAGAVAQRAVTVPSAVPVAADAVSAATSVAPDALGQQIAAAITAASPNTQVGVDVVNLETGASLAGLNVDQQFYTASVVKLLIAIDALKSQGWQPDPDTASQLRQMLAASDDDIADELWDANGADDIVHRMIDLMGLTGTQAPDDDTQWGETRTTPSDVVNIYRYIATSVPQPSRDLLVGALTGADQIAADGTDQYFGIPDGLPGTAWAVKQGWMTLGSSTTLDTTGLVGPQNDPLRYAVVLMTTQPADTTWAAGGSAVTAGIDVLRTILALPTTG